MQRASRRTLGFNILGLEYLQIPKTKYSILLINLLNYQLILYI